LLAVTVSLLFAYFITRSIGASPAGLRVEGALRATIANATPQTTSRTAAPNPTALRRMV
jgi:hypothetical protein